jgi:hypothetical protein
VPHKISRVQPPDISNEIRQLNTGCQAKPTIVQTSVYHHRVPSMKGTRSHVTEASTASLQSTIDKSPDKINLSR